MIDQKQVENAEYFKYVGGMISNDARYTCDIKSMIVMAKAAFNRKKTFITSKMEETSEVLHFEHSTVWCWNLDTSESRSEILGKFLNVVLEKDGEDRLDRSCEKWRSITQSQGEEEFPTYNKRKEG